MSATGLVLLHLAVIFLAAKLAGEVFRRLGQPPVIGELLVGILIGPYALGLIGNPNALLVSQFHGAESAREALDLVYEVVAELGAVVLLFFVGLETRLSDLVAVGPRAVAVGVLGIALPFVLGYGYMALSGASTPEALFVGTALVATSVGITARVLADLGVLQGREARIILGAAVVDDILAMVLLGVVSGVVGTGRVSVAGVSLVVAQAVGFTLFVALVGTRVVRRYSLHLERLRIRNPALVASLAVMLGLAALAGMLGLAAIIGAFLAGMVFAEAQERYDLEHRAMPLYEFLVPFFFVITGSRVDWHFFTRTELLGVAGVVILLAVVGKMAGSALGSLGLDRRSLAIVGVGMVPRGEVGLIVASLGLGLGVIGGDLFAVVVIMSVVTTLLAPPLLKWLYRGRAGPPTPEGGLPEL